MSIQKLSKIIKLLFKTAFRTVSQMQMFTVVRYRAAQLSY